MLLIPLSTLSCNEMHPFARYPGERLECQTSIQIATAPMHTLTIIPGLLEHISIEAEASRAGPKYAINRSSLAVRQLQIDARPVACGVVHLQSLIAVDEYIVIHVLLDALGNRILLHTTCTTRVELKIGRGTQMVGKLKRWQ